MEIIKVILAVVVILFLPPLAMFVVIKPISLILGKLVEKSNLVKEPKRVIKQNKFVTTSFKVLVEIMVGLTVLLAALNIMKLIAIPVIAVIITYGFSSVIGEVIIITICWAYAILIAYKAVRFIHQHLDFSDSK